VLAKKKTGWYGIRTLFRLVAVGKPKWTDRHFDPGSTLVEDRVVLFQATNPVDAVRQAEAEAKRYCKATRYQNIYGQRVRLKFLGATDAFSMFDNTPGAGSEVYSTTAIVPNSIRDSRVVTMWWGKQERHGRQARNKFIHGKILTEALMGMKEARKPSSP
jgi:hypothetical protein